MSSCYLYLTSIQAIFGSTPIPHPGNATSAIVSCYFTAIVALRDFTTRTSAKITAYAPNICFAVYCISNTTAVLNIYFFCISHDSPDMSFSMNIRILNCNIFYGTINIMSCAFSKQTDIIRRGITYQHSRHSMIPAVKVPSKRMTIGSYWCPFLIIKINIIFQYNIFSIVPFSVIHSFCKIRKLCRCLNLKWIILCTLSRSKPICNRYTIPGIYCFSFRSRTHRHGDPHQCRQCQQGQPHLYTPCFCIFHNIPPSYFYMEFQSYFHTTRIIYYTEKAKASSIFSIRFVSYFFVKFCRTGMLDATKKEPPDLSGHSSLPSLKNVSSFPRHLINVFISSSSRSRMIVWIIFLWKSL